MIRLELNMVFQGRDKLIFINIMAVYSEAIISIAIIPFAGIVPAIIFIICAIPLTFFSMKYYELTLYKKLQEEINGTPHWSGSLIDRSGNWRYVDIPIIEKEEVMISDQDLGNFEKQEMFRNALENVEKENEDVSQLISDARNGEQFVDPALQKQYRELELTTSRQIYCFELVKAYCSVSEEQSNTIIDDIEKMIKDGKKIDPKVPMPFFQTVVYNLFLLINKDHQFADITEYLELVIKTAGISETLLTGLDDYRHQTVRMENVEHIARDPNDISKQLKQYVLPMLGMIISVILTIVSITFIRDLFYKQLNSEEIIISANDEIMFNMLISFVIFPIILTFIFIMFSIKKTRKEASAPIAINIQNMMTKRFEFDKYCTIKTRLREYSSDARIYKVYPLQKYRKFIENDFFICVFPSSYDESLTFDMGTVPHRGYSVSTLTTPVVLLEIGTMFTSIPVYLMVACSYHFKRFTKIYYNYNILENWRDKVYYQIIASLQARLNMIKPENQVAKIQKDLWQNWAIEQAQNMGEMREVRANELSKIDHIQRTKMDDYQGQAEQPNSEEEEQEEAEPTQNSQLMNLKMLRQKRNMKFLLFVIGIAAILYIVFGIVIPNLPKIGV